MLHRVFSSSAQYTLYQIIRHITQTPSATDVHTVVPARCDLKVGCVPCSAYWRPCCLTEMKLPLAVTYIRNYEGRTESKQT
jgi:hypothetical protein